MNLARVRPWQWLAASLLLGLTLGYVADVSGQYAEPDFGETINGDRDFERALTAAAPGGRKGERVFRDLVVYPVRIAGDGGARAVHVVAGTYVSPDGTVRRRCYVAGIPYKPVRKGARGPAEYASVREYLDGLTKQGVSYRYAWWREPLWTVPTWTAGSVVFVGFLLPALVNYATFGTFRRPREEKGIDLSKVRSGTTDAARAPAAGVGNWDERAGDDAAGPLAAGASPSPAPAPSLLAAAPLELAAVEPAAPHSYGAGPEDFYPTERKAAPAANARPAERK